MRTGKSYFYPSSGPDVNAINTGIAWLCQHESSNKMVVMCGIKHAKNISCDSEAKKLFDLLYKQRKIPVDNINGTIELATSKTLPNSFNGAVIAIHLPEGELDKVDAIYGDFDVFYIPWGNGEGDKWKKRWGATDIVNNKPTPARMPVSNPQFEEIRRASASPHDHYHSNDYNRIVEVLKKQNTAGNMPAPDLITEYLKRIGWNFDAADDVGKMALKLSQGKTVRKK